MMSLFERQGLQDEGQEHDSGEKEVEPRGEVGIGEGPQFNEGYQYRQSEYFRHAPGF